MTLRFSPRPHHVRRLVVTNNIHDFVELHCEHARSGEPHPGIILALRTDPSTLVQKLERAARLLTAAIAANQLMYLDSFGSEEAAQSFAVSLTPASDI